jgi:hypothetical protein
MAIAWICDEHAEDLALFLVGQGIDHERHLFEILPTCVATEDNGLDLAEHDAARLGPWLTCRRSSE